MSQFVKGKQFVIEAVNSVHGLGFPDDHDFLRRVAAVESNYGENPSTYRTGYYGGIWQVDEVGYEATKDIKSHPNLKNWHQKIHDKFGIDWPKSQWNNCIDPLHSALAAR